MSALMTRCGDLKEEKLFKGVCRIRCLLKKTSGLSVNNNEYELGLLNNH